MLQNTKRPKHIEGYRIVNIPPEHLVSEFIAFPLATTAAFQTRLTRFDPTMETKSTQMLWRRAECQLVKVFPDFSIDQAVFIRDRLWFNYPDCSQKSVGLHHFLPRIAEEFLEVHGQFAVPRPVAYERERRAEENIIDVFNRYQTLRWLSFAIPTDLLLGALGGIKRSPPARIHYLTDRLHTVLKDRGVAETHLHIGAVLKFPAYWIATLHALGSYEIDEKAFKSPGADFSEGRWMGAWLLRAAIARCILAHYLAELHNRNFSALPFDFKKYFHMHVLLLTERLLGAVQAEALRICIKELLFGNFFYCGFRYTELRQIYRAIAPIVFQPFPEHPDCLYFHDPIADALGYRIRKEASPEIQFIHRGLNYLRQLDRINEKDQFFETLFWQTIRIRSILYRHIVQRPMIPGLQWFVRTYSRMKPGRATVGHKYLVRAGADLCGRNEGLRSLEMRTCPDSSLSDNLMFIKDTLAGIRHPQCSTETKVSTFDRLWHPLKKRRFFDVNSESSSTPGKGFEFGIVFHISRSRGKDSRKGLPLAFAKNSEADPGKNTLRYASYYRRKKNEALAVGRLIFNFPRSIKVLRGIDLCTDELGIPTWVLAPHLRYIRDAGKEAAKYLRYFFGEGIKAPMISVHAGEDYVHLLGGLRRMDEAIRYFGLRPGDRLGHAIALGINPEIWALRMGRIAMAREERLLDLVWEWTQYSSQDGVPSDSSRKAFIEREILRLSKLIFGRSCTPYEMETFVINLHDEKILKYIGYPDGPILKKDFGNGAAQTNDHEDHRNNNRQNRSDLIELVSHYMWCKRCFEAGQQIEWVDVTPEIEPLKRLQKHLRQLVARLDLVIEINPTSNLLIGNLTDLTNHPMWRLNPPLGQDKDLPPVTICIGSDDPLTFATNLRWEYELLHENLVAGGLSSDQACKWLDRIRQTGLDNRFTFLTTRVPKTKDENLYACTSWPTSCYALDLDRNVELMP